MTVQASVHISIELKEPPWESKRTIITAPTDKIQERVNEWLAGLVRAHDEREANRSPSKDSRSAQNPYRMSRSQSPPRNYRGD